MGENNDRRKPEVGTASRHTTEILVVRVGRPAGRPVSDQKGRWDQEKNGMSKPWTTCQNFTYVRRASSESKFVLVCHNFLSFVLFCSKNSDRQTVSLSVCTHSYGKIYLTCSREFVTDIPPGIVSHTYFLSQTRTHAT